MLPKAGVYAKVVERKLARVLFAHKQDTNKIPILLSNNRGVKTSQLMRVHHICLNKASSQQLQEFSQMHLRHTRNIDLIHQLHYSAYKQVKYAYGFILI